jgi:YD repeat-containing protein
MRLSDSDPVPGRFLAPLRRTYDSRNTTGVFGRGWTSVFDSWLAVNGIRDPLDRVHVQTEDGERFIFVRESGPYRQVWPVPDRAPGSLVLDPSGDFLHREPGSTLVRVFRNGKVVALRESGTNHEITITWDANGRPSSVADSWGSWNWTISTDAGGRISTISVDGRSDLQWTYTRNGSGNLTSVSTPAGVWRTYTYGNGYLETARDGGGHLIESHVYDASGQAWTSSGDAGRSRASNTTLPDARPANGERESCMQAPRPTSTTGTSPDRCAPCRLTARATAARKTVYSHTTQADVIREQDALGYVHERRTHRIV